MAMIFAQPLGPLIQEHLTTSARLKGMRVVGIDRQMRGDVPVHHVLTRG
jgi:hypothetical protein